MRWPPWRGYRRCGGTLNAESVLPAATGSGAGSRQEQVPFTSPRKPHFCFSVLQVKRTFCNTTPRSILEIVLFFTTQKIAPPKWSLKKFLDTRACSSPRKSLVKGERFIRSEEKPEYVFTFPSGATHLRLSLLRIQRPRLRLGLTLYCPVPFSRERIEPDLTPDQRSRGVPARTLPCLRHRRAVHPGYANYPEY